MPRGTSSGDKGSRNRQHWEKYWLQEYGQFHAVPARAPLPTDERSVTEFLINIRHKGKPAWQRLQVLRFIIDYSKNQLHLDTCALEIMATKLQSLVKREKIEDIQNVNDRAGFMTRWSAVAS